MCVHCELSDVLSEYNSLPKDQFKIICDLWEKERMRVLSKVSFENLNKFLRKLDKHFIEKLKKLNKRRPKGAVILCYNR
jgi:hypothetical protein